MNDNYSITTDPIFYITVAFFALLTTALPAALGQPRFLPAVQALSLTVFAAMALRQRRLRQAIWVFALWLIVQVVVMTAITWLLPSLVERAIPSGFEYRTEVTAWRFTGAAYPRGVIASPWARVIEMIGVTLGALVSGGLIGNWFLMRAANLAGYSVGSLLLTTDPSLAFSLRLPFWSLFQLTGYAGLVIWMSQPILTNKWLPSYYWQEQKRLITVAIGLVIIGLLLELLLASP